MSITPQEGTPVVWNKFPSGESVGSKEICYARKDGWMDGRDSNHVGLGTKPLVPIIKIKVKSNSSLREVRVCNPL